MGLDMFPTHTHMHAHTHTRVCVWHSSRSTCYCKLGLMQCCFRFQNFIGTLSDSTEAPRHPKALEARMGSRRDGRHTQRQADTQTNTPKKWNTYTTHTWAPDETHTRTPRDETHTHTKRWRAPDETHKMKHTRWNTHTRCATLVNAMPRPPSTQCRRPREQRQRTQTLFPGPDWRRQPPHSPRPAAGARQPRKEGKRRRTTSSTAGATNQAQKLTLSTVRGVPTSRRALTSSRPARREAELGNLVMRKGAGLRGKGAGLG